MPYPNIYAVTYSYTGFQQAQGNNTFPGTQIDADFAGLRASVSNLSLFTQGVMRSDGQLSNSIVTYDSLSPALQTAGIAPANPWVAATFYGLGNSVVINSNLYRCIVAHTSGVFATDLAAGKWLFITAFVSANKRISLTADATYYADVVNGLDTNSGQAPGVGNAFKTIQRAVDYFSANYDLNGFAVRILVAPGTYPENVILPSYVGIRKLAQATAIIQSATGVVSSVIVQPSGGGNAFTGVETVVGWALKSITINAPGAIGVRADYDTKIYLDGVAFGSANVHVQSTYTGAFIEFINSPYTISGAVISHADAQSDGEVVWQAAATCSGTVVVSGNFLQSSSGLCNCSAANIFGSVVASGAGTKFGITYGGNVRTSNDANPNSVLPAGLATGTINIWPVQAGPSYTNLLANIKQNLQIAGRATDGSDATVNIAAAQLPLIVNTIPLTATRNWNLPAANSVSPGDRLTILDGGGISSAKYINVQRSGADSFVGLGVSGNAIQLQQAFAGLTVESDGASLWQLIGFYGVQTVPMGGTGSTGFSANGLVLGNGGSALGVTAAGVNNQFVIGQTGGAPIWATYAASATIDATTQANVAFTGLAAAAAAVDADTFPTNQGAGNLKQTLAAVKTWIKSWISAADLSTGTLPSARFPAFTTTTPVPTSSAGALTTASSSIDAVVMNKLVVIVGTITITTVGTGTGTLQLTLPATPAKNGVISGVNLSNGKALAAYYNSGSAALNIIYYDGTTAIAANNYQFSGVFEST